MAVYNVRLRIAGNGYRYDYRFSPLLELIPSNNKNSLFTRHIIVNIHVLTKFCTIIVGIYDISALLRLHQIPFRTKTCVANEHDGTSLVSPNTIVSFIFTISELVVVLVHILDDSSSRVFDSLVK